MVSVNKKKCIGCGGCASVCSEVFEMKNGKAYVKSKTTKPCVKKAIALCPVNAIKE